MKWLDSQCPNTPCEVLLSSWLSLYLLNMSPGTLLTARLARSKSQEAREEAAAVFTADYQAARSKTRT